MLSILLCLVIFIAFYWAWTATYWQRRGVKGPIGWPVVGNLLPFAMGRQHYGDVFAKIYREYNDLPFVGVYLLFNEPCILLRSSEMVKEVMIRQFQHFQDNALYVDARREALVVCNPFIARGDKWRCMRNEIVPIFTPNKVKSSFPHIESVCRKLNAYVWNRVNLNCFEAKNLFTKYTLDVVASAAYGLDAQCFTHTDCDLMQLVENLFLPQPCSLWQTAALLFSPTLGKLMKYSYLPQNVALWLRTITGDILRLRLDEKSESGEQHLDFIQWLLENKRKLNEPIERDTVAGHCTTFLMEGFETSASLMAFAMYEYARNPLEQRQVLCEIDKVLALHQGQLCYEALQAMTFLEASLYETLRLHPAMAALLKRCTKSVTFPAQTKLQAGFQVPQGMTIIVPVKAVHYDPVLYPDPLAFRPQRFLADKESRASCNFLGFGAGPRMCPGGRFGLAQAKAGLASLLSQFSVHLPEEHQRNPLQMATATFLTAARAGIWLQLKPRI